MRSAPRSPTFAANISFVNFHNAFEHSGQSWMRECVANPVHHKTRRAVRTESEHPMNLKRADSLFGTAKQIPSNQPFSQGNVRIFKDRSDRHGELLVALRAMIQTSAN